MEFLEAIHLCDPRNHRVFHSPARYSIVLRYFLLYDRVYNAGFDNYKNIDLRRSHLGMAIFGLYYLLVKRNTDVLHRCCGTVFGKDLFRDQEQTDIHNRGIEHQR